MYMLFDYSSFRSSYFRPHHRPRTFLDFFLHNVIGYAHARKDYRALVQYHGP